jgi:putative membrane protein insertion efficiency factor
MKKIQQPTTNIQSPLEARSRHHWMPVAGCWMRDVPKVALIFIVRAYRLVLSPAQTFLFGPAGGCRFTPTCSAYAVEAVREHGAVTGTVLAAKRICRCHPWGGCGHDPVPTSGGRKVEKENILHPAHS